MIEKLDTEFNGAPVYDASSVNSSLSRIRNTLNYSLKKKYGIEDPKITEQFMKIHGLDKQRFEFISNFEHLIENGIATDSVDSNSNKGSVSTAGLLVETALPINKLIGYRYLYRKMNELYGKKRAKFLSGEMYDESIAIADSTALLRPYCFSINAQKLVLEGRPWGAAPSLPPHRVGSYIAALCETIHQLSNHLAGAIAVGSFFFDIAHLILNEEKRTLSDIKSDPVYRKYIENALQSFVHSVNHLSRNSTESPFSNISIFDRPKIKGMIAQYFDWYFDYDDVSPRVKEECPSEAGWLEYVMDIILEAQEIYMEVMDRGDVLHDGRQFTFPVSTVNISKKKLEDGSYEIEDPEFLDNFCKKHDVVRYNIYTAVGEKIASCHDFDDAFYYEDSKGSKYVEKIGEFVELRLNGLQNQSDVSEELYVRGPEGEKIKINAVFKLKNESESLVHLEFENGQIFDVTPDHEFLVKNSKGEKVLMKAIDIIKSPEEFDF